MFLGIKNAVLEMFLSAMTFMDTIRLLWVVKFVHKQLVRWYSGMNVFHCLLTKQNDFFHCKSIIWRAFNPFVLRMAQTHVIGIIIKWAAWICPGKLSFRSAQCTVCPSLYSFVSVFFSLFGALWGVVLFGSSVLVFWVFILFGFCFDFKWIKEIKMSCIWPHILS